MPNRMIRAGLLESEAVLSCSVEARWLFITMLLSADDLGICEATEFTLARRADMRREHVVGALQQLADRDLVRLYDGPGLRRFGFIPRFGQRLRLRKLRHPLPPDQLLDDDARRLVEQMGSRKINNLTSEMTDKCPPPADIRAQRAATCRPEAEAEAEAEANTLRRGTLKRPDAGARDPRVFPDEAETDAAATPPMPTAPMPTAPTSAAVVCMRLRAAGIADVNPSHPRLLALLDAGATADEFAAFAHRAVGKAAGFAYLLGIVASERQRAADESRTYRSGAMPAAPEPAWARDRRERIAQFAGPAAAKPRSSAAPANTTEVVDAASRRLG